MKTKQMKNNQKFIRDNYSKCKEYLEKSMNERKMLLNGKSGDENLGIIKTCLKYTEYGHIKAKFIQDARNRTVSILCEPRVVLVKISDRIAFFDRVLTVDQSSALLTPGSYFVDDEGRLSCIVSTFLGNSVIKKSQLKDMEKAAYALARIGTDIANTVREERKMNALAAAIENDYEKMWNELDGVEPEDINSDIDAPDEHDNHDALDAEMRKTADEILTIIREANEEERRKRMLEKASLNIGKECPADEGENGRKNFSVNDGGKDISVKNSRKDISAKDDVETKGESSAAEPAPSLEDFANSLDDDEEDT